MNTGSIEERLAKLEREMKRLRSRVNDSAAPNWRKIIGIFANDPSFSEVMRLGREYRESLESRQ
jgi:hypothetical protein